MKPEKLIIDGRGTEKTVRYTNLTPEEQQIELPDKRRISVDWRKTFEMISGMKELVRRHDITQEEGEYRVKLDNKNSHYALGIVFSDAHIGSITSDHELIKDILELTLNTPNTFLLDAGDTFDNGIWGGLQFEQAIPPYLQRFTIKDIARDLGDKFAAVVVGNHPEWLFTATGQKPEDLFYEEVEGPIFPGMGLLHLKAGRQKYDIAMAHTYWGRSKLNIHNVCHNLRKYEYPEADVFIVGHEHIWGHEEEMSAGRKILNVRPGTAKIDDRYARLHGIAKRGQKMGIGIVFGTDRNFMQAMSLLDAVDYVTK
jgi:hypothetical protein